MTDLHIPMQWTSAQHALSSPPAHSPFCAFVAIATWQFALGFSTLAASCLRACAMSSRHKQALRHHLVLTWGQLGPLAYTSYADLLAGQST